MEKSPSFNGLSWPCTCVHTCISLRRSWNDTGAVQEMSQEQLEEMMERQGQSQAQGGKQMEISLEEQKGSSAQDSDQQ